MTQPTTKKIPRMHKARKMRMVAGTAIRAKRRMPVTAKPKTTTMQKTLPSRPSHRLHTKLKF